MNRKETFEKYKQAIDEGLTYKQMAERFGIREDAVGKYCRRKGLITSFMKKCKLNSRLKNFCLENGFHYLSAYNLMKKAKMNYEQIESYLLERRRLKDARAGEEKAIRTLASKGNKVEN